MGNPRDDTFGGPVMPIVAPMDLDAGVLSAIIRRYHYPVFAEVHHGNVDRLCADYCVVYVLGVEMAEDIKRGVNDMNIPTGVINATTEGEFVAHFGLESGNFIVLKRKTSEFVVWKEITTWMTFRRKFELMNNGIGGFRRDPSIPEFTSPIGEVTNIKKIEWEVIRFRINDVMNVIYGKVKTWPPTAIVIGLILVLIAIGESISFCLGACWRCVRPKVHTH
jgi:hypothetical protein